MVIRISYDHDCELLPVLDRLQDLPLKVGKKQYETNGHKRIYLRSIDRAKSAAGSGSEAHHQTE